MLDLCTPHARARMQQRGIRPEALEMLLDYGAERYIHQNGREILHECQRENPRRTSEAFSRVRRLPFRNYRDNASADGQRRVPSAFEAHLSNA